MNTHFGHSLHLDCYGCEKLDCLETAYRFLEELVDKINMTIFYGTIVVNGMDF